MEILSIGNELLLGNTVNTNASWIATRVTSLGGRLTRITTVADSLKEISTAVRDTLKRRPDLLITTGGIGPTFDDMTLRGVARALGTRLKLDQRAVAMIRRHYGRRFRGRRMSLTKPRLKMAHIPSGSTPISNPIGTAPGVRLVAHGTEIFCLPGVPKEAKAIFNGPVSKSIVGRALRTIFLEKWLRAEGIVESSLAPLIDRTMRAWRGVYIKSHPRGFESGRAVIMLHFSASSRKRADTEKMILAAIHNLEKDMKARGAKVKKI